MQHRLCNDNVYTTPALSHSQVITNLWSFTLSISLIAERLSARLLIVQRSQFTFVCMYVCMYVYPSHFNCVGMVSVVSSPDY